MPPSRTPLGPRVPGFVCRSCLLRLYSPQRQRPPWLVRHATESHGPNKHKKSIQPSLNEEDRFVRYFEQNPDGERTEVAEDENDAFLDAMGPEFEELQRRRREFLGTSKDDLGGIAEEDMDDAIQGRIDEEEDTRDITAANNYLEGLIAQIKSLSEGDVVSEENRLKIRELLFNIKRPEEDLKARNEFEMDLTDVPPHPSDFISPDVIPKIEEKVLRPKLPQKGSDAGGLDIHFPKKMFPEASRKHLSALHAIIHKAAHDDDSKNSNFRKSVWRHYLMCRSALLSTPQYVPLGIWSGMWIILSKSDKTDYVDRMAHLKYLGDDIKKVGVRMDIQQELLYLEALLVYGENDVAVTQWEKVGAKAKKSDHLDDYYELGVKLFCQAGDFLRALETAKNMLRNSVDSSAYRILLPIIQSCLAARTMAGVQLAWALYIRLRVNLGYNMEMSDYDTITLCFLEAKQPALALAAFKDMMLKPNMSRELDSAAVYGSSTDSKIKLDSIEINKDELNRIDVYKILPLLPPEFNNKFFFGSWIKKLIGEGELEAARRVMNHMSERGIRPDARHMNGLIGALMREGTSKSLKSAEDMAWKMINARLLFVNKRNPQYNLDGPLRVVESRDKPDSKKPVLVIPSATIETFSILVQNYRRRQMNAELLDLFDTLRIADVKPNTYFMNQLLSMDTKNQEADWAWTTYTGLTGSGVRPDYETFTILFHHLCQIMRVVVRSKRDRIQEFPMARSLFSEMIKHRETLQNEGPFSRDLYDSIILAFSLGEDQAGTAVALRALQQYFKALPGDQTARTIINQLTRLGQQNKSGYKTRRLNLGQRETKERISQVTKIFHKFKQERDAFLLEQGIVFDDLTDEEKLEEASVVLSDLLRYAFSTKAEAEDREIYTAQVVCQVAAKDMGVPMCVPWKEQKMLE